MAFIRLLEELTGADSSRQHTEVDATWKRVQTQDGRLLFQLDTYGSDDRKATGQASQNFQVDRDTAQALIAILQETFSL